MLITKLLKNLSFLKEQLSSKQPVVLITDGSMNPVHQQHVGMLEIVQKYLEEKDQKKIKNSKW